MAIHTFLYRFTAEVKITVDDSKAPQRQPEEIAADALYVYGDGLIDHEHCDDEIYHLGGVETGITGEVTKIPTWDPV